MATDYLTQLFEESLRPTQFIRMIAHWKKTNDADSIRLYKQFTHIIVSEVPSMHLLYHRQMDIASTIVASFLHFRLFSTNQHSFVEMYLLSAPRRQHSDESHFASLVLHKRFLLRNATSFDAIDSLTRTLTDENLFSTLDTSQEGKTTDEDSKQPIQTFKHPFSTPLVPLKPAITLSTTLPDPSSPASSSKPFTEFTQSPPFSCQPFSNAVRPVMTGQQVIQLQSLFDLHTEPIVVPSYEAQKNFKILLLKPEPAKDKIDSFLTSFGKDHAILLAFLSQSYPPPHIPSDFTSTLDHPQLNPPSLPPFSTSSSNITFTPPNSGEHFVIQPASHSINFQQTINDLHQYELYNTSSRLLLVYFAKYLACVSIAVEKKFKTVELMLNTLDWAELHWMLINEIYFLVHSLIFSRQSSLSSNTSLSSISATDLDFLKTLGAFLGMSTIKRNKPILKQSLDIETILLVSFQTARLHRVIPFVCQVMNSCEDSQVFPPTQPWSIWILALLAAFSELPLRQHLLVDIQALFQTLRVKLPSSVEETRQVTSSPPPQTSAPTRPGSFPLPSEQQTNETPVTIPEPIMKRARQLILRCKLKLNPLQNLDFDSQTLFMNASILQATINPKAPSPKEQFSNLTVAVFNESMKQFIGNGSRILNPFNAKHDVFTFRYPKQSSDKDTNDIPSPQFELNPIITKHVPISKEHNIPNTSYHLLISPFCVSVNSLYSTQLNQAANTIIVSAISNAVQAQRHFQMTDTLFYRIHHPQSDDETEIAHCSLVKAGVRKSVLSTALSFVKSLAGQLIKTLAPTIVISSGVLFFDSLDRHFISSSSRNNTKNHSSFLKDPRHFHKIRDFFEDFVIKAFLTFCEKRTVQLVSDVIPSEMDYYFNFSHASLYGERVLGDKASISLDWHEHSLSWLYHLPPVACDLLLDSKSPEFKTEWAHCSNLYFFTQQTTLLPGSPKASGTADPLFPSEWTPFTKFLTCVQAEASSPFSSDLSLHHLPTNIPTKIEEQLNEIFKSCLDDCTTQCEHFNSLFDNVFQQEINIKLLEKELRSIHQIQNSTPEKTTTQTETFTQQINDLEADIFKMQLESYSTSCSISDASTSLVTFIANAIRQSFTKAISIAADYSETITKYFNEKKDADDIVKQLGNVRSIFSPQTRLISPHIFNQIILLATRQRERVMQKITAKLARLMIEDVGSFALVHDNDRLKGIKSTRHTQYMCVKRSHPLQRATDHKPLQEGVDPSDIAIELIPFELILQRVNSFQNVLNGLLSVSPSGVQSGIEHIIQVTGFGVGGDPHNFLFIPMELGVIEQIGEVGTEEQNGKLSKDQTASSKQLPSDDGPTQNGSDDLTENEKMVSIKLDKSMQRLWIDWKNWMYVSSLISFIQNGTVCMSVVADCFKRGLEKRSGALRKSTTLQRDGGHTFNVASIIALINTLHFLESFFEGIDILIPSSSKHDTRLPDQTPTSISARVISHNDTLFQALVPLLVGILTVLKEWKRSQESTETMSSFDECTKEHKLVHDLNDTPLSIRMQNICQPLESLCSLLAHQLLQRCQFDQPTTAILQEIEQLASSFICDDHSHKSRPQNNLFHGPHLYSRDPSLTSSDRMKPNLALDRRGKREIIIRVFDLWMESVLSKNYHHDLTDDVRALSVLQEENLVALFPIDKSSFNFTDLFKLLILHCTNLVSQPGSRTRYTSEDSTFSLAESRLIPLNILCRFVWMCCHLLSLSSDVRNSNRIKPLFPYSSRFFFLILSSCLDAVTSLLLSFRYLDPLHQEAFHHIITVLLQVTMEEITWKGFVPSSPAIVEMSPPTASDGENQTESYQILYKPSVLPNLDDFEDSEIERMRSRENLESHYTLLFSSALLRINPLYLPSSSLFFTWSLTNPHLINSLAREHFHIAKLDDKEKDPRSHVKRHVKVEKRTSEATMLCRMLTYIFSLIDHPKTREGPFLPLANLRNTLTSFVQFQEYICKSQKFQVSVQTFGTIDSSMAKTVCLYVSIVILLILAFVSVLLGIISEIVIGIAEQNSVLSIIGGIPGSALFQSAVIELIGVFILREFINIKQSTI
ncbi:putative CCR4-NOT transcription complex subunit 1 CAF1-binding domain containing protein [Blattamonas nauphoetae]|uniref:CCR4-NOT transcription complex subunit 1 CAF1-binding domain containing protein n=1 Tax=Blattamonas nauphoetae TaxID=2049346 RepID=A0ABQ9YLD7_9EUKA|nr:putative CCR4-NOT transcription complex subunit 1 CAF1-binding domain containing protein [Blattamonas nauphoetae]